VLFDPTNTSDLAAKLRELMEDPSRRTDLGREAAKRIERFAVAHTAQRITAVYDTVLHGS
jgi:glycosyltransferase involved in cell wall biosynthesis